MMEGQPGAASYRVLVGRDPMGRLIDDLEQMIAAADAFGDDISTVISHLLKHAQDGQRLHALLQAELVAIVARADGELFVSESELVATSGLKFTHKPEADGFRLTLAPMDESRDQA